MNKNVKLIWKFWFLYLFSMQTSCIDYFTNKQVPEEYQEFARVVPQVDIDTICNHEVDSNSSKISLSFRNSWNHLLLVGAEGKVLFKDSVITDLSTAVSNSFIVFDEADDKLDSVLVYVPSEKIKFNVRLDYRYSFIKVYWYHGVIILNYTNCTNIIY